MQPIIDEITEPTRFDMVCGRIRGWLSPLPLLDEDEGLRTRISINEESKERVIAGIVADNMAGWTPTVWSKAHPQ